MTVQHRFRSIVDELARLHAQREVAMLTAFAALERQDAALAVLITQNLGDRTRAARWMCMHQRAFGGRSAYETLADGEIDRVWDRVLGSEGIDGALLPSEARMAY
ncbi:DUF2384 domain-containing protein [Dyella sp.]|uniref:DUF2384 domain-containing protein n=1 Tax=Dyella sp. TaxID=1869338 RepID=UPI002D7693C8|nr:DUF2384 domain-containing protein [Dyella sp.]HET6433739.1 DUF2384 domain-containing protein [Dyella sp.]